MGIIDRIFYPFFRLNAKIILEIWAWERFRFYKALEKEKASNALHTAH
jgi:hypothetical protein